MFRGAPASVESVRLDPELRDELAEYARTGGTTTSQLIREALRRFLRAGQARQGVHGATRWQLFAQKVSTPRASLPASMSSTISRKPSSGRDSVTNSSRTWRRAN